ncbi:MAG: BtpA/SgcQ family protein [Phycisphaeraceae bacterium]|nr:BtpA/SgcQ family protein [Phycisphaeraceae bacterium]
MEAILEEWASVSHPVIGMVHLQALPGSPRFAGDFGVVIEAAVADALVWGQAGADGLMVENFGDVPFYKGGAPRETVAAMTRVAGEIRRAVPAVPLGINVLRNDGLSAIAVAAAVGASYVRVNVLSGAAVTDQGVIEGQAADLMRYRKALGAEHMKVLADVRVKHAAPLAERSLQDEVEELVKRAGADAVIVSGTGTGKPTDPSHAEEVKRYAGDTPVLIGSGADAQSIPLLKSACDGFIVGSAAKPGGEIDQPVDLSLANQVIGAN